MSWLGVLQDYVSRYDDQLRKHGFSKFRSQDGPGMGAVIEWSHKLFDISVDNDRGDFILFLQCRGSKRVEFSLILAFLAAIRNGKDFAELSFKEKVGYWKLDYSLEDPFAAFFPNLEDIFAMIKTSDQATIDRWVESYYNGRKRWLFGKNF